MEELEHIVVMYYQDECRELHKIVDTIIYKLGGVDEITDYYSIADDNNSFAREFNTKNTFIFLPLFHYFTKANKEDSVFADFLTEFEDNLYMKKVNVNDKYISYAELDEQRTTKDKSTIVDKVELLKVLLDEYLKGIDIAKAS